VKSRLKHARGPSQKLYLDSIVARALLVADFIDSFGQLLT
jgi:hypothetical protein